MALIPCGSNSVLSSTGREGDHFYLPVLRRIPRSELIFVRVAAAHARARAHSKNYAYQNGKAHPLGALRPD
jgi:hypothetical protein